jgi:cytochrome c oxidase subunit 2
MRSALLALAVPGFRGNPSVLNPAGPQAGRIEHQFALTFWITAMVYVLVMLVLVVGVWRKRARTSEFPPPMSTTPESDRIAIRAVAAAMIATVVLLFVILVGSFLTGRHISALAAQNPVTINVYGHQWWWELNYPNGEADKTVDTANEIHVPVGVPVMIHSTSRDVIHSFWAPNVHGKRDLLPGYQTDIFIQVDHPGRWRGQCAEFCGVQHAHMAFDIVAQPETDYRAWLEAQAQSAPDPSSPQAAHGQTVFLSHACVMCHTIRGTTAGARTGADLTHLASRATIAAGTLPNTIGNLGGWIANPQSIKPGSRMPPNPLPAQDLQDLLAYLETLR